MKKIAGNNLWSAWEVQATKRPFFYDLNGCGEVELRAIDKVSWPNFLLLQPVENDYDGGVCGIIPLAYSGKRLIVPRLPNMVLSLGCIGMFPMRSGKYAREQFLTGMFTPFDGLDESDEDVSDYFDGIVHSISKRRKIPLTASVGTKGCYYPRPFSGKHYLHCPKRSPWAEFATEAARIMDSLFKNSWRK